jgi:hypothetical protein
MGDTQALQQPKNELEDLMLYLSEDEIAEIDMLIADIPLPAWTPQPGPQTEAYHSLADEIFYGGAAGGGKTDLLMGTALTQHYQSIIFRREFAQLKGIRERAEELYRPWGSYNGMDLLWRFKGQYQGRTCEFGACQWEGGELKYQGRPHDLKGFDEITHFSEKQFRFLKGWNRTTRLGVRTRVIAAGNPPLNAEGQWVNRYWRAWLDPLYPNPAKPGELRWYITDEHGDDIEVSDSTPRFIRISSVEQWVKPTSRTFIRARVQDNTYLIRTGYLTTLQALPEPLRSRMLEGDFGVAEEDHEWQVIPSAWILQAQARWAPTYEEYLLKLHDRLAAKRAEAIDPDTGLKRYQNPSDASDYSPSGDTSLSSSPAKGPTSPEIPFVAAAGPGVDLSVFLSDTQQKLNSDRLQFVQGTDSNMPGSRAVGVDVARGGRDQSVAAPRTGSWFNHLHAIDGEKTPDGPSLIDWLVELGYKDWPLKVDVTGVGSSPVDVGILREMDVTGLNGAERSEATDRSGLLRFHNTRAEDHWTFREALDPELGLEIALPPDPELAADLAAPRWSISMKGILVEDKKKIKDRIGRSPNRGDAVINGFSQRYREGLGYLHFYRDQVAAAKALAEAKGASRQ